jgi:hypothetical protein
MTDNIHIYNYTDDNVNIDTVFSDDTIKSRITQHLTSNKINGTVYIYESNFLKALLYIDKNFNPEVEFKDNTFSRVSFFQIFYVKMSEPLFTNDFFIDFVKSLTNQPDDDAHKITFIICTGHNELSNITAETSGSYTISKISSVDKNVSVYDTYTLPNTSELNYVVITKGDGKVKEGVESATSTEEKEEELPAPAEVPEVSETYVTPENDTSRAETDAPTTESEEIINVDTKNENDTTALVQHAAQLGVNTDKIEALTSTINQLENNQTPLSEDDKKTLTNAELSLEKLKDENKELKKIIKEDEAHVTKDETNVTELQEGIEEEARIKQQQEEEEVKIKEEARRIKQEEKRIKEQEKRRNIQDELRIEQEQEEQAKIEQENWDFEIAQEAKKKQSQNQKTKSYSKNNFVGGRGGKRRTKKNKGKKVGK